MTIATVSTAASWGSTPDLLFSGMQAKTVILWIIKCTWIHTSAEALGMLEHIHASVTTHAIVAAFIKRRMPYIMLPLESRRLLKISPAVECPGVVAPS